jgi:hypothetical protein
VAIVPPESKGKSEGNDWETACGSFKTSISSIYYNKKCVCSFSLPKLFLNKLFLFYLVATSIGSM